MSSTVNHRYRISNLEETDCRLQRHCLHFETTWKKEFVKLCYLPAGVSIHLERNRVDFWLEKTPVKRATTDTKEKAIRIGNTNDE